MRTTALPAVLLATASLLASEPKAVTPANAPTPVTLLLQWTDQSQFAGYYVALEEGFYRQRGLAVTIIRGGPDRDPAELLRSAKADFATLFLTTALRYRDRGLPVVLAAQVVNRSNAMVVAWRDRGIRSVRDLDGRRVSVWGDQFAAPFLDFFERNDVHPLIVPQYGSVELFLRHGVDACVGMNYNEYHRIYQAGVDPESLTTFLLRDYGVSFPEDGIYCLQPFLAAHREAVRAFVDASLEGWRYAAAHREQAGDIALAYALHRHAAINRPQSDWMLDTLLPTIVPGASDRWTEGQLSPDDYTDVVAHLRAYGLIQHAVPYVDFCGTVVPRHHVP